MYWVHAGIVPRVLSFASHFQVSPAPKIRYRTMALTCRSSEGRETFERPRLQWIPLGFGVRQSPAALGFGSTTHAILPIGYSCHV